MEEIRVTYDGTTYKVRPDRASYIRVDGMRWEITSGLSGAYTLHMTDIKHDVTVWGKKTYTSGSGSTSGTYRISTSEDSHCDVSYTAATPSPTMRLLPLPWILTATTSLIMSASA